MKIASADRQIDRISTSNTENRFTIKATGKAFKILSGGLYKDKVRAVVRELSCNAYDAHVLAGCPERPFDVHLPNTLEPYFSIRDYGPSLGPKEIISVYTTYFESTKTDSNELIGGLGLGSKTPFCLVDSFPVISYLDGVKRTYTCFFDENDTPSIILMAEEDTEEENGLEIKIPVNNNRISDFMGRAREVYAHFDPIPNITGASGFKPIEEHAIMEGDGYRVIQGYGKCRAKMGVVCYPLDTRYTGALSPYNITIDFPIGDVEVTASREELSYTQDTINAITRRVNEVLEDIKARQVDLISKCPNEFEARKMYGSFLRSMPVISGGVPYRGIMIDTGAFIVPVPGGVSVTIYRRGVRSSVKNPVSGTLSLDANSNFVIIVDDDSGKFLPTKISMFRGNNTGTEVICVRPCQEYTYGHDDNGMVVKNVFVESDVQNCYDFIGKLDGVSFKKLSGMDKPAPTPKSAVMPYVLTRAEVSGDIGDNIGSSRHWIRSSEGDFDGCDKVLYMTSKSGSIVYPDDFVKLSKYSTGYESSMMLIVAALKGMELWEKGWTVAVVPVSVAKSYENKEGWVYLPDFVKDVLDKFTNDSEAKDKLSLAVQYRRFDDEYYHINRRGKIEVVAKNLPKNHALNRLDEDISLGRTYYSAIGNIVILAKSVKYKTNNPASITRRWVEITKKYPLVSPMLASSDFGDTVLSHLVEYVKLVDKN